VSVKVKVAGASQASIGISRQHWLAFFSSTLDICIRAHAVSRPKVGLASPVWKELIISVSIGSDHLLENDIPTVMRFTFDMGDPKYVLFQFDLRRSLR